MLFNYQYKLFLGVNFKEKYFQSNLGSGKMNGDNTHTHTHTYIYIYICIQSSEYSNEPLFEKLLIR